MLVLPRKQSERLVVEFDTGSVEFTIVAIERDKVRVGLTAPREAAIFRPELLPDTPPEPHPIRTVLRSLAAGLRTPFEDALASGVTADALSSAVRSAVERAVAALVTSSSPGGCTPTPAAGIDGA